MIFDKQISRNPNHYPQMQRYVDAMWDGFWTPRKFNFQADIQGFRVDLDDKEREIIVRSLSAISQVEIDVKTFWARLGDHLPHPAFNDLGGVFAGVEIIHTQAYEKLLKVLGLTDVWEKNLDVPVIRDRVGYLKKHLNKVYENDRKQFLYALILFTIFIESVSLFSQFYIVSWFYRYKNVLNDTSRQVQYTAKEEFLHAAAGIEIIRIIRVEHPELFDEDLNRQVRGAAEAALEAESRLIDWILGDYADTDISADVVKGYAGLQLNYALTNAGFDKVADVTDEIAAQTSWMDEEVLGGAMTDFFHNTPIEYAKSNQSFNPEEMF